MTEKTRLGKIEVSPSAIASLASHAVLKSYGVVGMASANLRDGIAEVLTGDRSKKGVQVKLERNQISIDLYVVIEYGTRISVVANNIMSAVKFSVEKTLGMPVKEVNVHVQGLRVSSAD
jgi:uncharacterized alkaline shock family protein YloU